MGYIWVGAEPPPLPGGWWAWEGVRAGVLQPLPSGEHGEGQELGLGGGHLAV